MKFLQFFSTIHDIAPLACQIDQTPLDHFMSFSPFFLITQFAKSTTRKTEFHQTKASRIPSWWRNLFVLYMCRDWYKNIDFIAIAFEHIHFIWISIKYRFSAFCRKFQGRIKKKIEKYLHEIRINFHSKSFQSWN